MRLTWVGLIAVILVGAGCGNEFRSATAESATSSPSATVSPLAEAGVSAGESARQPGVLGEECAGPEIAIVVRSVRVYPELISYEACNVVGDGPIMFGSSGYRITIDVEAGEQIKVEPGPGWDVVMHSDPTFVRRDNETFEVLRARLPPRWGPADQWRRHRPLPSRMESGEQRRRREKFKGAPANRDR